MTQTELDLLVLGSGVAGLSAAVRAAGTHAMSVGVVTKGELDQATTRWAQGGVAAVLGGDPDSTDLHLADTLSAGADLCDVEAVRVLVDEGPGRVTELIALGAAFDRDPTGELLFAREGGHSLARILHAGGAATGLEIERALVVAVQQTAAQLHERAFAVDLIVEDGRCAGVIVVTETGEITHVRAKNVLISTGGGGQLFAVTTNPVEATGDGTAMALRAGVATADTEFVQFHPTALHHPLMPRPLLSEALRGHGALLRDTEGERFVDELLPRDEVSRAMTARMSLQGVDHLWLDATVLENFDERFPTIAASLQSVGLNPATDWLPIAPAAHYQCGGIVTDLDGATSLPGLWAAGEVACTGVHGANRLASNSLLEGMVFGFRAVEAVERGGSAPQPTGAMRSVIGPGPDDPTEGHSALIGGLPLGDVVVGGWVDGDGEVDTAALRDELQRKMTTGAGVLRSAESLAKTAAAIEVIATRLVGAAPSRGVSEVRNLVDLARVVLAAAAKRSESRGAHTREDYLEKSDDLRVRLVSGPAASPTGTLEER